MNRTYKIALVEDEEKYRSEISSFLSMYGSSVGCTFDVFQFENAERFLTGYNGSYDIVFMDIALPGMDGMESARKLRELDKCVVLIFITGLAQFAAQGYEVDALDYIVKPVSYKVFAAKLDRALSRIDADADRQIVVSNKQETYRVSARDIVYIEVRGHYLFFHIAGSPEIESCGTLSKLYAKLGDCGFACCNRCYLLNMKYIKKIGSYDVTMTNGDNLIISRGKRKTFLKEFMAYANSSPEGGTK